MPRHFHRRRRFGSGRAIVTQSTCILKRKSKCRHCGQSMAVGETATRLRLKKAVAVVGCVTCSRRLVKLKNFHPACCPSDINKAMGYDPAVTPSPVNTAVPPPPKPKTTQDLDLEAIASLEAALLARARQRGITPQLEKAFKTFQNIKARVLRPGTPGEGEAATNVALKRIIDMVFG